VADFNTVDFDFTDNITLSPKNMQRSNWPSIIFLGLASIISAIILINDDSFSNMKSTELALNEQRELNRRLVREVEELRSSGERILHSDTEIERVAREQLLMSRPDELVFLVE
jgi:cell division protein FtsB